MSEPSDDTGTWHATTVRPVDGALTHSDGPGVIVEVDVLAPAGAIWPFVADIDLSDRFSDEFRGAE